jgi:hypothetical protein
MPLCDFIQIQTDVDRCITMSKGQPAITVHEGYHVRVAENPLGILHTEHVLLGFDSHIHRHGSSCFVVLRYVVQVLLGPVVLKPVPWLGMFHALTSFDGRLFRD